jgi:hypothetical protein
MQGSWGKELRDIYDYLTEHQYSSQRPLDIFRGKSAIPLFCYEYGHYIDSKAIQKKAELAILEMVALSLQAPQSSCFYSGLLGNLWVARYILGDTKLDRLLPKGLRKELLIKLSDYLEQSSKYDLVGGISGWYIFARSVPRSQWFISLLQKRLKALKHPHHGLWGNLNNEQNWGYGHGMIAPLLIRNNKMESLRYLKFAHDHLLKQKKARKKRPNSWVFGDISTAYVGCILAKRFNKPRLLKIFNEFFEFASKASNNSGISDESYFARGYSSMALISLKHYELTKIRSSLEHADFWLAKMKGMIPREKYPVEVGLLRGHSGNGLIILKRLQPKRKWEQVLLL